MNVLATLITRVKRSKRLAAALLASGAAALAVAALVLVLPLWAGIALIGLTMLGLAAFAAAKGAELLRTHRDLAAEAVCYEAPGASRNAPGDRSRHIGRARAALEGGFPDSALELAKGVAADTRVPADRRLELMRSVLEWSLEDHRRRGEPRERSRLDLVMITHFGLPGGNTSACAAEIRACRDLGLTVGLVHHPVLAWRPNAPVDERIEQLVDGDQVRLLDSRDQVACDLAIVRLPTVMVEPLQVRPDIDAAATVVIANQTPYRFYGPDGSRELAWDPATTDGHVTDWLGPHTWYAGGPAVLRVLTEHHGDQVAALDLAPEPWNECIDTAVWRLDGRREKDGRIKIGRHSRDHELKWPAESELLRQCYPEGDPFEIHVLGGADTPARVLGGLPGNWTVHPFGALPAREFLARIDLMVYFIADDGVEAFGRAPLEAMAAGVPVIMDPRFEGTFGDAAIYCDPADVEFTARALMDDAEAYRARQAAARAFVESNFSPRALAERLARHGVAVAGSAAP